MIDEKKIPLSWIEIPIKSNDPKRKGKYSIFKYPIFKECYEMEDDLYWKKIFLDMAYNKFPKSFHIQEKGLIITSHNNKNKIQEKLTLNMTDINIISKLVKEFIRNNSYHQSEKDFKTKKMNIEKIREESSNKSRIWGKLGIRQKSILIYDYFEKIDPLLTKHDIIKLQSILSILQLHENLSNKHYVLENGCIKKIIGVHYNKENKSLVVDQKELEKPTISKPIQDKRENVNIFIRLWSNFLKDYAVKTKKYEDSLRDLTEATEYIT